MNQKQRGFSLIELLAVLSILALMTLVALPSFVRAYEDAKEDEVKANLHIIQVALERYGVDHSGAFPPYILGGDLRGWDRESGCRAVRRALPEALPEDSFNEAMFRTFTGTGFASPSPEPLIENGYLDSYPRNPFIHPGDGVNIIILATGASVNPGDGDVRFGWDGEVMGNCLNDPRVLFDSLGRPTSLANTMWSVCGAYLGVLNEHSPNPFYCMGGIPEWVRRGGGQSNPEGGTLRAWWPGEFFYRAGGEFDLDEENGLPIAVREHIWYWPYLRINKYMLGAYGSLRTEGLDVIRLTLKDGRNASIGGMMNGYHYREFYQDHSDPEAERSHPDFDVMVHYSTPEVFGGGERGLMPQFPYYESGTREWMFGAPDGYPDGVILVLTSVSD